MAVTIRSFSSLYSATLLMVLAAGLLTTYLGLKLASLEVAKVWIGAMMSAYYLGLVLGSKIGHRLIARVGHIRAFTASCGVVTASALGHALTDVLEIWLLLRLAVGMCMMCQYMVLESWLNEQADSNNRGTIFASYMIVSYLGLVLGQGAMSLNPGLTIKPLLLVAICFALCVVPLVLTRRIHPQPLKPAPLKIKVFWQQVPQSLTTIAMAGVIVGSFYGLAPAFAAAQGLSTEQVALYMATTVMAGLLAQWPMGKLSDRVRRSRLIRTNAAILGALVLLIALLPLSGWPQLALTFLFGVFAFTLYPLGTALANQNVDQHERVALSATILLTFGLGASIGPLLASVAMQLAGPRMLYGFMAVIALLLFIRLQQVNYQQKQQDKTSSSDYQMASGDVIGSPLAAALDPRVSQQDVVAQMSAERYGEPNVDSTSTESTSAEAATAQQLQFELAFEESNMATPVDNAPKTAATDEVSLAERPNATTGQHQQDDAIAPNGTHSDTTCGALFDTDCQTTAVADNSGSTNARSRKQQDF